MLASPMPIIIYWQCLVSDVLKAHLCIDGLILSTFIQIIVA